MVVLIVTVVLRFFRPLGNHLQCLEFEDIYRLRTLLHFSGFFLYIVLNFFFYIFFYIKNVEAEIRKKRSACVRGGKISPAPVQECHLASVM